MSAQVAGKRVVIYDDMIRTGGSLLDAAQAYRDAGAVAIDAIATHGLFPGDSLAKIRSERACSASRRHTTAIRGRSRSPADFLAGRQHRQRC